MRATRLRVDHAEAEGLGGNSPLALTSGRPRFSWWCASDVADDVQQSYRIVVGTAEEVARGEGSCWDSGTVASEDTLLVPYGGAVLGSRARCWWAVEVTGVDGAATWSEPAAFEVGLLTAEDWQARWIGAPLDLRRPVPGPHPVDVAGWTPRSPVVLRRRFSLAAGAEVARMHLTARGLVSVRIDGVDVGEDVLVPGWVDFHKRQPYRTYDVTGLLGAGEHVIEATLADGWYAGRLAWTQRLYGEHPELLLQLEVTDGGGQRQVIASDGDWTAGTGSLVWADLLMGASVDLGAPPGPELPVVVGATPSSGPGPVPEPAPGPPVRRLARLAPVAVRATGDKRWTLDLGQNMVGTVHLRVTTDPWARLVLRYGEVANADGRPYRGNLRTALATDIVVAGPDGVVDVEFPFTFHGFRYVEIDGLAVAPALEDVTGVVLGSDVRDTAELDTSSQLLQQLNANTRWGMRGNFLEVPTDCPQRDERLGWMGDAQIFVGTASYLGDAAGFFDKWLRDVEDASIHEGVFADVAPLVRPELFSTGSPGWGDAGVVVPWLVYVHTGDRDLLARSYPSMAAWVDGLVAANPDLVWRHRRGMDYGDWLSLDAPTPKDLIATAQLCRSLDLVARAASVLGDADAADRRATAEAARRGFGEEFATARGRLLGDTQTAYAVAIDLGLLDGELRQAAGEHLAANVRGREVHLSTGFLGVSHLLPALASSGHLDLAYQLLEQDTFPSWGYPITLGATTIWERWDSLRDDKGLGSEGMNSFNHYAYGSVMQWVYDTVVGLRPDPSAPGWRRFTVAPQPGGTLTHARLALDSPVGRIEAGWQREADQLSVDVLVPANTRATVVLPGEPDQPHQLGAGRHHLEGRVPGRQRPPGPAGARRPMLHA